MSRKLWGAIAALGFTLGMGTADAGDLVGMHDFDQRRDGLPVGGKSKTEGGGHCVPAAIMNELYFLEDHGYATILPGLTDPTQHDDVTASIATLGLFIGTGAGSNNPSQGEVAAYLSHVDILRPNSDAFFLTSVSYSSDPSNDVTFSNLKAQFDSLTLISFTLRKYDDSNAPNLVKKQSHHLTLVGLEKTSSGRYKVRYHDPFIESPEDDQHQSPYHVEEITMQDEVAIYDGTLATLMREVGGDRRALISFFAIKPFFVLSDFTNPQVAASAPAGLAGTTDSTAVLTVTTPGNARLGGPERITIPHQTGAARDIAVHPAAPRAAYIEAGSNEVWEASLVDGGTRVLARRKAPRRLAYGGRRPTLFVLDGRQIVSLRPDGRVWRTATSSVRLDDLAWDPVRDRLVAVSASAGAVLYYDEDLHRRGQDALPLVPGEGPLEVATDARSRRLWLHRHGSPVVVAMGYEEDGRPFSYPVELHASVAPLGLAVDDRGYLITSEGGVLQAHDLSGARSTRLPLSGIPSGPVFAIPHDFDNYDESRLGLMDTERTIEEEEGH